MMLATVQAENDDENPTPEAIAVAGISMKQEFDGLVRTQPPFFFVCNLNPSSAAPTFFFKHC